ncbi:MAG: DUF4386 domain-containing protein [Chloroflexi bacterium]|nr:DUF4386 domain-containing protein [Chloroflexota bacterium]
MLSKRKIEYLAGALLIAMVAAVVVSIAVNPISAQTFKEDPSGVLVDIAVDRNLFITSAIFDLLSNLLTIPLAAVLYLAFRSHDRNLALLGSFGFLAAAMLFLTSDMILVSLAPLAQDFVVASGQQADSVLSSATAIGLMLDAAVAMGAVGIALGVFSFGLLIITTGAMPRWIGVFGILGGIVSPFFWLLFVNDDLVIVGFVGLMISLFFSLMVGGRLVMRGTSEAAQ